jgi:hypothetical protein
VSGVLRNDFDFIFQIRIVTFRAGTTRNRFDRFFVLIKKCDVIYEELWKNSG